MSRGAGIGLIAGGVVVVGITVFVLWHRVAGAQALGMLAAAGIAIGAGALGVEGHAGIGDWIITLGALSVLTPIHMRLVFGHPGGRVVAEPSPAA